MIEILIACVIFATAGGCVLYVLAYPRDGFWRCQQCTVVFEARELGLCPYCQSRGPHRYLGTEYKRW